ncbi:cache domain-containing sensor histidine kinase [Paenibacillus azoreducens]|uniref:Histidine kinase n=1 Tax=Paenibacillus azoreducens TaxID=116718 RepID=A0A919YEL9_9BACL|nr:sensor histidine kinase [Paenibacillus azoreducens]GIO47705.1 histidine kinase [Paenibacillus azoreducens]
MFVTNRNRTRKDKASLLTRLSIPIFALIVTFIALFSTAASYILIHVQNDHNRKMAEQSMKFVYRNVWYQFDTMNNVAAFILTNQSIENLLENAHRETFDAVDDFFALQTNLQNLSLLSLVNDIGSQNAPQQSYNVSLALDPGSGLYPLATDHFYPVTGIFKSEDLRDESWFRSLGQGGRKTVWWGQKTGRSGAQMIYSARKKTSIKDGRNIGTVIVGADIGSIKGVFENAPLEKGFHLLLDESDRVIYSERYGFLELMGDHPYIQGITGTKGSFATKVDGKMDRVMFETLENGWKLLTVVPESHFNQYTFAISAIGAVTAAAAVIVAGVWLRRIVVRVTVPITRLVNAIQRPEVVEFKEPLPRQKSGIYEVDELNEKFASMLVTIHGLIEKSFAEEMERRQLQLELLHAQINPHFLYNTLDLINCRAIMAGDMEASRIVRSLANVFRFGLNQGQTWISLGDEMKQVEAYLQIQQIMMDHLRVEIKVPEELLSSTVIHLCLQPLAENSIIHGFADQPAACRIAITAQTDETNLVLCVEDNGRGCDAERMNQALQEHEEQPVGFPGGQLHENGAGYGTMNVHRRIQLHCGKAYGLRYKKTDIGTCVEVVFPLRFASPGS